MNASVYIHLPDAEEHCMKSMISVSHVSMCVQASASITFPSFCSSCDNTKSYLPLPYILLFRV